MRWYGLHRHAQMAHCLPCPCRRFGCTMPLNRPRSRNRHLDHQIEVVARLQTRQACSSAPVTRPETPGARPGNSVSYTTDPRPGCPVAQRPFWFSSPQRSPHHVERGGMQLNMQSQAIDFQARRVDVVPVPLNHRALRHAAFYKGTRRSRRPPGDDKPPGAARDGGSRSGVVANSTSCRLALVLIEADSRSRWPNVPWL